MISKKERLNIFLERLKAVPPANSADEALELLGKVLNAVEDEFFGVASNPEAWLDDRRMYPPQEDNRRDVPDKPWLRRYRSAQHNTFIGMNGSIQIQDLENRVLLDKRGANGQRTSELGTQHGRVR